MQGNCTVLSVIVKHRFHVCDKVHDDDPPGSYTIVSQLIWREFFYAMSANNPFYGEMEHNPICINIPWYDNDKQLEAYMNGNTGYPFIDAGVRQMKSLSCQRCPQNIFMNARYLLIIIYLLI